MQQALELTGPERYSGGDDEGEEGLGVVVVAHRDAAPIVERAAFAHNDGWTHRELLTVGW